MSEKSPVGDLKSGSFIELMTNPAMLFENTNQFTSNRAFSELIGTETSDFAEFSRRLLLEIETQFARQPANEISFRIKRSQSVGDEFIQGRAMLIGTGESSAQKKWLCAFEQTNFENSLHSTRLAALGQMASGIAHEINNPLTVILARASLLEMKLQEPAHLDSIRKIQMHAQRISKITRGLRLFGRDDGDDPLIDFNLKDVIEDSIAIASERAKSNGIRIYSEIEPSIIAVGRSYQVSQVIINLLNNACDAVAATPLGEVHVTMEHANGFAIVRVRDNGPGVSEEIEKKIMTPFFTTKTVGKGTGLGLSISHGIAKAHGGTLALNRTYGPSCFEFTLPAKFNNQLEEKRAA